MDAFLAFQCNCTFFNRLGYDYDPRNFRFKLQQEICNNIVIKCSLIWLKLKPHQRMSIAKTSVMESL
jgi:hypothetical protein